MGQTKKTAKQAQREANVLLELQMHAAMSEELLDANSDDVIEAVQKYASDVALGATISLNLADCAILLRFDLLAANDADIYKQIAKVVAVLEKRTDLSFESSRSNVRSHGDEVEPSTGDFAAC